MRIIIYYTRAHTHTQNILFLGPVCLSLPIDSLFVYNLLGFFFNRVWPDILCLPECWQIKRNDWNVECNNQLHGIYSLPLEYITLCELPQPIPILTYYYTQSLTLSSLSAFIINQMKMKSKEYSIGIRTHPLSIICTNICNCTCKHTITT